MPLESTFTFNLFNLLPTMTLRWRLCRLHKINTNVYYFRNFKWYAVRDPLRTEGANSTSC